MIQMKFFYETVDSANFERGNAKLFVDKYSKAYFDDYPRNDAKLEKHIIKKCEKGDIDLDCIVWKFGRKPEDEKKRLEKYGFICNGYGGHILGSELDEYFRFIKKNRNRLSELLCTNDIQKENVKEAFKILTNKTKVPHNFGTVYIITVMFFLSQGRIPIYDKFAHIAVEAIINEKKPNEIFIEEPKSKDNVKGAIDMLYRYMDSLDKVFETRKDSIQFISREEDQALWVYGHMFKKGK